MKYDPLITYLEKHGECPFEVALSLLSEYKTKENKYTTISRLIHRRVLERFYINKEPYLRLTIRVRKVLPRLEDTPIKNQTTLLYALIVNYGAEHPYSQPRTDFMNMLRLWYNEYRREFQFIDMIREIIDNPPAPREFRSMRKGLVEAGWINEDYHAADHIREVIDMIVDGRENYLGIPDSRWDTLSDVDGLGRIVPTNGSKGT